MPPCSYQSSRAELCEEFDMPGADVETVHDALFTPVAVAERHRKQESNDDF